MTEFECQRCGSLFEQESPWHCVCPSCSPRKGKSKPAAQVIREVEYKPIEPEMLQRLIYLVHPDKHSNSEAANIATRFLLDLKTRQ